MRLANRLAGYVKSEHEESDENMPHFTVVPVKDQVQSSYDSLEGINCVDYRDTGQDYPDHQDTVSTDGEPHNFYSNFASSQSLKTHDFNVTWQKSLRSVIVSTGREDLLLPERVLKSWLYGYHGNPSKPKNGFPRHFLCRQLFLALQRLFQTVLEL